MFRRALPSTIVVTSLLCMQSLYSVAATTSYSEDYNSFSPKEFRNFPITKITQISPNTKHIECKLPSPQHVMGMTTASCIMINGVGKDGKTIARPYTPTSLNDDKGKFELVIKAYPDGNVSSYIDKLKVGDEISVKGPFAKLKYEPNMKKSIGMIAGGTGITPMLQVIKEILKNPNDKTQIHLIFANNSEEDILLKDMLDNLEKNHGNFKVTYVLSKPSNNWKGEKGFVSKNLIQSKLPGPSNDVMIFVCGPPPMMKAISGDKTPDYKQGPVEGLLKDLNFVEDMVYKF